MCEQCAELQARAARAEAERDTLQAMWNTLADAAKGVLGANPPIPLENLVKLEHAVYSEHPDTIAPARRELDRLRTVREAAETESRELLRLADLYMAEDGTPGPLSSEWAWRDISKDYRKVGQSLRRALDACTQDPAR